MPERTIGVGLISVGWMGRAHSRAYRAVHEHYPDLPARPRLRIAADIAEAGRRDATELLGYDENTADYREVLARPDVDVVSICAPNFLHREMGLAAAEAGKPFWIAKPMGAAWPRATTSPAPPRGPASSPPSASATVTRLPSRTPARSSERAVWAP